MPSKTDGNGSQKENIRFLIPCSCFEQRMLKASARKMAYSGIGRLVHKNGETAVGAVLSGPPLLVGGKNRVEVEFFRFCPWCGKQMYEEVENGKT